MGGSDVWMGDCQYIIKCELTEVSGVLSLNLEVLETAWFLPKERK